MCSRHRWTFVLTFIAVLLSLFTVAGTARAGESIDGNNPPTVRNNMHSCPPGSIVTGVHVGNNQLLCLGQFSGPSGHLTTGETVVSGNLWPPDSVTRVAHGYGSTLPSIPWCGPDRYVTGVHVTNRQLNCAQFPSATNRNYTPRLGHIVVDYGTSPTVRSNMHACPRGHVMVGANFDNNTFLCAELPFCQEASHCPGGLAGEVCEFQSIACDEDCLFTTTGVCRRQGVLSFREDNGCLEDFVGWLTERSGNQVNFTNNDAFTNDEARSLSLSNVRAGTIIRVYDNSGGSESDDWTQIFAKANISSTCVGTFQTSSDSSSLRIDHHRVDNLDGKVSRVDVRSALIDFGGRCVDVNTNNNAAQIFDCHAGPNQSWIHEVDGEIRGINGLCLEANSSEIHTWPNLAAGQVRRAAVRVANCNGSVNQKWTVTEAGQIRMFADMCLDIVNGTSQNNAALQIYPCHGGQNQRWLSSF